MATLGFAERMAAKQKAMAAKRTGLGNVPKPGNKKATTKTAKAGKPSKKAVVRKGATISAKALPRKGAVIGNKLKKSVKKG